MSNQKVALVTGSARRIGKALIEALHAQDYRVVIHYDQSKQEAEELLQQCLEKRPNSAIALAANLDDPQRCAKLISHAYQHWKRLDVLINNASRYFPTTVGETTSDQWHELMNANLLSPYFLSQAASPHLLKSKGCIINMSDINATRPFRDHGVYCASKAGLNMLTKSLALELAPHIRVNAIALGPTLPKTSQAKAELEKKRALIPLKKYGNLEDIARTVFFLIENSHITGQIISLDGGKSL